MTKSKTIFYLIIFNSMCMFAPFFISAPVYIISGLAIFILAKKAELGRAPFIFNEWHLYFIYLFVLGIYLKSLLTMGFAIALYFYYLFIKIYLDQMDLAKYRLLLKLMALISSLLALDAIRRYLYYISLNELPWHYILSSTNPFHRAESFFFNPNYYGLFCAMMVTVAVYLIGIAQNHWQRVAYLFVAGLNGIALILTGSRMAIPTVLVGVLFILFFMFRKLFYLALVTGILCLVVIIAYPGGLGRFSTLLYGFSDRFEIWDIAANIFLIKPLTGRGAFAYSQYYYLFSDETKMHAHNFAIDLLANFGLIGFLLVINAATPFVRQCGQIIKSRQLSHERVLAWAVIALAVVHSLMDVSLIWLQTGYFFLIIISFPFASNKKKFEG